MKLGVGIIGYGFIGRVHALSYLSLPFYYKPLPAEVELIGVATAHMETAEAGIAEAGFKFATDDFHKLLARDDIHIIHCCTPNYLHKEILLGAMKAGKHIYCDKPLCMSVTEATEILDEVKRHPKGKYQMSFEYRFIPAIMRARQLINEGKLGDVFHFRAEYLHSGYINPERPMSWRLDKSRAGGGALFDLGSHVIDLVLFLLGEIDSVNALCKTFIEERPIEKGAKDKAKVEVDDLCIMQVSLKEGGVGVLEASRMATGTNNDLRFEVHGTKGALKFDLMDPNWLYFYDLQRAGEPIGGERGFTKIETVQRYPEPVVFPGPKFEIGWMRYSIASLFDFLKCVAEDGNPLPSLEDGAKVQTVMEAAYLSAKGRRWVEVKDFS